MFLKVWVLTLFIGSGGSVQYYFGSQSDCLKAREWYSSNGPSGLRTCYPSLVPADKK